MPRQVIQLLQVVRIFYEHVMLYILCSIHFLQPHKSLAIVITFHCTKIKPRERLIAWVGLVAWALEGTCESHFNHFLEAFGHDVKLKLVQLTWQNPILSQGDVLSILVLQSSSPNWTTSSHHAWQLSSYHSSSHKLFSHSSSQALKMLPWYKNTETSSYEHIMGPCTYTISLCRNPGLTWLYPFDIFSCIFFGSHHLHLSL